MKFSQIALTATVTVFVILIIILIYRAYSHTSHTSLISSPIVFSRASVSTNKNIKFSKRGIEWSYNLWLYLIPDTNVSQAKFILQRSKGPPKKHSPSSPPIDNSSCEEGDIGAPAIWLVNGNTIQVRVSSSRLSKSQQDHLQLDRDNYSVYYDPINTPVSTGNIQKCQKYVNTNPHKYEKAASMNDVFNVYNIPLQRWVQISVILNNRTVDIYVNGKLYSSYILPSLPYWDENTNIFVGSRSSGSHIPVPNGKISNVSYFDYAITAQKVQSLYKQGPIDRVGSWLSWMSHLRHNIAVNMNISDD